MTRSFTKAIKLAASESRPWLSAYLLHICYHLLMLCCFVFRTKSKLPVWPLMPSVSANSSNRISMQPSTPAQNRWPAFKAETVREPRPYRRINGRGPRQKKSRMSLKLMWTNMKYVQILNSNEVKELAHNGFNYLKISRWAVLVWGIRRYQAHGKGQEKASRFDMA